MLANYPDIQVSFTYTYMEECLMNGIENVFCGTIFQDEVREELNEVFSHGENHEITINDLSRLQYLEMVLKESLRLYPSVPYFTRRIPFDLHIGEYFFIFRNEK